jgi:ribosome-associated toxin RatA of RatAB toxin-antitoxin module
MVHTSKSFLVHKSVESVRNIILDFTQYHTFLSDVRDVRDLGEGRIQFSMDVSILRIRVDYVLQFKISDSRVSWTLVESNYPKILLENTGSWTFSKCTDETCILQYESDINAYPALTTPFIRKQVPKTLLEMGVRLSRAS